MYKRQYEHLSALVKAISIANLCERAVKERRLFTGALSRYESTVSTFHVLE